MVFPFWNKNFDDEGCAIPYYDMREDSPFSSELARTSRAPVLLWDGGREKSGGEDIERLLKNGFLVEWGDVDACRECIVSNGRCSPDDASASFVCICPDGRHRPRNCRKGHLAKSIALGSVAGVVGLLLAFAAIFLYIADFGLAKLCPRKESILSMAEARGTIGYMAPEVFSRSFGAVSTKSDVYSYGMMVLEMVGGRKNIKACADDGTSAVYFPHWIYQYLDGGEDDLRAGDVTAETEEIPRKMMLVGLCIQTAPPNRPCMSRVAEMLERSVGDIQIPPKRYLLLRID
ncbi:hypothetical protein OPV22_023194 [Ensete ventricosum]|uniref:Protein kinase domain-containing protein n=1 Tax=Ensete ventricosum TaxID=4639 RepID=A0AAV8QUW4_ENSVE|nr:hypothetical protein OPV22_023194 [Ensete ventricosum]